MKFLLVLMVIAIVNGCDVSWNCQRCTEDCFFVMVEDGEHLCLDSYSPALHGLMEILAPGSVFFCPPSSATASPTTISSSAPSSVPPPLLASSTSTSTSSLSSSSLPPTNEKTSSMSPFAIVGIVGVSTMIAVAVMFLFLKYIKKNHARLHEEMCIDDFV